MASVGRGLVERDLKRSASPTDSSETTIRVKAMIRINFNLDLDLEDERVVGFNGVLPGSMCVCKCIC